MHARLSEALPKKVALKPIGPVVEKLRMIKSDDEKQVLGSILHQFYWKTFTGNDGAAIAPEAPIEEENPGTPAT